MSQEYGRWIPLAKNGEQSGIWVDNSIGITRGGVVGVRTDEGSFLSIGTQGLTAIVGDGATVTTGSPRRLVVLNPNTQAIRALAVKVDTNTAAVATKAEQSDLDTAQAAIDELNSTKASTDLATKGAAGLVLQATDVTDLDPAATLADVIAAINNILASDRDAGQRG